MLKHTPGPWKVKGFNVVKSDGFKIRQERPRACAPEAWEEIDHQFSANAYLIAASPDLLEACERVLQFTEPNGKPVDGFKFRESILAMQAVIANAKGLNTEREGMSAIHGENSMNEATQGGSPMKYEFFELEELFDLIVQPNDTCIIAKPLSFLTFQPAEKKMVLDALGLTEEQFEAHEHVKILFDTAEQASEQMGVLDGKSKDAVFARLYVNGRYVRTNDWSETA